MRQHFGSKGDVTDARVVRTKDGRSRQFGFVGFRTEAQAEAARKYFHRSYIDTSRISVDTALMRGNTSLNRPWSRYSSGSSRYEREHDAGAPTTGARKKGATSAARRHSFEAGGGTDGEIVGAMRSSLTSMRHTSSCWTRAG